MLRRSSCGPVLPQLNDVEDDQRDNCDEQHYCQRASSTYVELNEGLRVHLIGNDLGSVVAVRHHADDVEDLQNRKHHKEINV